MSVKYVVSVFAALLVGFAISPTYSTEVISCNGFESCPAGSPALEARIAALEALLADVSRVTDANTGQDTLRFAGMNVQVIDGKGTTDGDPIGTGNLIIGYNELGGGPNLRSGSHMLVIGRMNNYTSYGGMVVGTNNKAYGIQSSISGGSSNTTTATYASISGGYLNNAQHLYASVSGGYNNTASGEYASVSGGSDNTASGLYASVSGGSENTASGQQSSVSGGHDNLASGQNASISGGIDNDANFGAASVNGGYSNTASGTAASVSGGFSKTAGSSYCTTAGEIGTDCTP